MPNPLLSILVVDDAKFSSVMIGRALSKAGYQDIRFASSAADALAQHEQRPAHVLLADWLMPEMDGLELTGLIRQRDAVGGHYSYVILLTGRDSENALGHAFDHGVDDFISKSAMNEQLLPRIFAADRLCGSLQKLKQENHQLAENVACLEQHSLQDPLTATCSSGWPPACGRWKTAARRCITCRLVWQKPIRYASAMAKRCTQKSSVPSPPACNS